MIFKKNKDIVKKFFTLIQNFLIKDLCQTQSSRVFLISSIDKNFKKKFFKSNMILEYLKSSLNKNTFNFQSYY